VPSTAETRTGGGAVVGKPVARLKRIGSVQFMRVELLIENYYCVNLVKRMGFFLFGVLPPHSISSVQSHLFSSPIGVCASLFCFFFIMIISSGTQFFSLVWKQRNHLGGGFRNPLGDPVLVLVLTLFIFKTPNYMLARTLTERVV